MLFLPSLAEDSNKVLRGPPRSTAPNPYRVKVVVNEIGARKHSDGPAITVRTVLECLAPGTSRPVTILVNPKGFSYEFAVLRGK